MNTNLIRNILNIIFMVLALAALLTDQKPVEHKDL